MNGLELRLKKKGADGKAGAPEFAGKREDFFKMESLFDREGKNPKTKIFMLDGVPNPNRIPDKKAILEFQAASKKALEDARRKLKE